jgi:uncharacterized protein YjiS (DUF1127 family)
MNDDNSISQENVMVTISKIGPASAASLPGGRYGWRPGLARRLVFGLLRFLVVWQRRVADRETLAAMDESRLRDLGLTSAEVRREIAKPFWRA